MKTQIEIIEVKSKSDLKDFINLPDKIYSKYPNYVRPLNLHMKMMMGDLSTPNKKFLIAKKDGVAVARIGAKLHKHNSTERLHFGFFECVEGHLDACQALVNHARQLFPKHSTMGPFHFRMEDPYVGVLAEGFDFEPFFLMPFNPPYYLEYLEAAGLKKVMDLFTYELKAANFDSEGVVIKKNSSEAAQKGVTIRFLNKKKLKEEARIIAEIFNDALSRNWGYEEFLDDQVNEMVTLFKLFIDERMVAIAQYQGKDVGCLIMLPNYNPIIKGSQGRVTFPLIWKYFKRKKLLNSIRGYALGVKKEAHGLGIGSALTQALFDAGPNYGYEVGEVSWVLANNGPMNELSKAMGGKTNKVYRIYEAPPLQN